MSAEIVECPVHRPTISERLERSLFANGWRWALGVSLFVWGLIVSLLAFVP